MLDKNKIFIIFILSFILMACGSDELYIDQLKNQLKNVSDYSIILNDMKEEGNFSSTYFHKYQVVQADKSWTTDWQEVPKDFYEKNKTFLGMTLASAVGGKAVNNVSPPGYNFVGNEQYGQWRQDSSGNSFWEFYGKYRMFTDVLGFLSGPIYRRDYDDYDYNRSRRRPYFGRHNQYGTNGTFTKQSKPNFYERRMKREQAKKSSFSDKVSKRFGRTSYSSSKIGRTRSGFSSRSFSRGK